MNRTDDLPEVPKGFVDVDGEILPLSKEFYLTQNGSCSQVPMKTAYTSTEWPYDVAKMNVCAKEGNHPHIVVRSMAKSKTGKSRPPLHR